MDAFLTRLRQLAVPLIFLWVILFSLAAAWMESPTTDEIIHVASGYLAITRHEFRFDPEHPFLFKMISAAPVAALHPHAPENDAALWDTAKPTFYDSWREARDWSERWFYTSGNNADLMIFLARLPAILALLGLCWLVYTAGTAWFSRRVGILALIFTAFNPTLLEHGHFANTDVPVALGYFATLYLLWRYWKQPNRMQAILLGLVAGATILTKYSGLAVLPVIGLAFLIRAVRTKGYGRTLGDLLLAGIVTLALMWISYLGRSHFIEAPGVLLISLTRVNQIFVAHGWSVTNFFIAAGHIVPVDYLRGLAIVAGSTADGRGTYLLGHVYPLGTHVWSYFPIVYTLKTQIIGLILLVTGAVLACWTRFWKRLTLTDFILLLGGATFGFFTLMNKLTIGIRHMTPLMPILSFGMALSLVALTKRWRWATGTAIALYVVPTILWSGSLIGYTNLFVQPRTEAWRYMHDSNIEWGQQSKQIARIDAGAFSQETIYTNYLWSPYALGYYGVRTEHFDPAHPPHGALVMLTAINLASDEYAAYRDMKPVEVIGNHTFFYRIP